MKLPWLPRARLLWTLPALRARLSTGCARPPPRALAVAVGRWHGALGALLGALSLGLPQPGWAQAPPTGLPTAGTGIEARPSTLELQLDGHVLSNSLPVLTDGARTLLPLGELARLLGLAITVDAAQRSVGGFVLGDDRRFALDIAESRVRIGDRESSFEARHVTMVDKELYVSSRLLAQWLSIDLEVDLSAQQLRVKPRLPLPLQERLARGSASAQLGRPRLQDRSADANPLAAPPRHVEANLLVLETRLDGHVLSDSLSAYQDGRHILLPLGELARLLTLAITVRAEQASASGFVLREELGFELSVADALVRVGGREQAFEARHAAVIGDDIYVSSQLLSRWLPIDLETDLSTLQLRVKPRKRLPLQERLARESAAERLAGGRAEPRDRGHTRVSSPLQLLSVPMIDQTVGAEARVGGDARQTKASYATYLTGDLLGMEAAAYVSGSRDKRSPDTRFTLARHDPDGGLLGPLQARSLVAGNISLPGVAHVMLARANGSGVALSNRPLDQPTSFDRHSLRGDLPPGWDVTLYYNDALTGYQQSRADGRYAFDELPLSFGPNEFRLVFNGPLGQVRVERQRFLLDRSIVKPGEFLYALAHHRADNGELRSVAQVDLGLTRAVAASVGLVRKPGAATDGDRVYTQFGLRSYGESMILGAQVTVAPGGGALAELGLKTRLGRFAVDYQHLRRFADFESELIAGGAGATSYRDTLRLNGALRPPGLPPVTLALEAVRDALASGTDQLQIQGRISTRLLGTSVSNSLRWQHMGSTDSADGSLQLSRRVVGIGLSAQLGYTLQPQAALQTVALTADRGLAEGYRVNAGLLRTMATGSTLATAGLSKNLGDFGLALNGSVSSQREFALGVQIFVALGRDPRSGHWSADAQPLAGTGAVSARAFVDLNLNGVRDRGEELVPNAAFILNGGGRHPSRTDATGTAFIGRLPPGQYTDIALDPGTLEDPQWQPLTPGVRVLARPGRVEVIEFPVVLASEIDGIVYVIENGRRRGIGDARVELVAGHGRVVASTTSSADGYYLLHQVLPGHHTLRIAPDQVTKLRLTGALERAIEVPANGDFVSGQDFELRWSVPRAGG